MGYIDYTKIKEVRARQVIARDPSYGDTALELATIDINSLCNRRQVLIEDIPTNETTGELTSPVLYQCCRYRFLQHLYESVQGLVSEDEAEYTRDEALRYEKRAIMLESEISRAIILNEEVTDLKDRSGGEIPIL